MLLRRCSKPNIHSSKIMLYIWSTLRSVLWAKTVWNNHRRSVSKAINAFKPSIERQTTAIRETRSIIKWFCSMTMFDSMSQSQSKHIWKRWNGKSYPICRILQTLLPLTIICFDQWHMAWLTSTYVLMKKSKIWYMDMWIASTDEQFFRRGIRTLSKKWKNVVASDGQYFES